MNLLQPEERTHVEVQDLDAIDPTSKATLMAALEASGMPLVLCLDAAKRTYPSLRSVRDSLDEHCGNGPGLCELEGRLLAPLVPAALQDWPVWYVRLADDWADDVTRLVESEWLEPHLLRDDLDPWYVAQWVAIVSELGPSGWYDDARRVEVDDRAVAWTFREGARSGGVLVLFECAGRITVTAYPVDEALLGCLQGGDGASSRHPLFDLSLAEVQAMTRALEDGKGPGCMADVVRLPAVHLGDTEEHLAQEALWRRVTEASHRPGPQVSCALHDDGAMGRLLDIVEWWPTLEDPPGGTWLALTLPAELHERFSRDGVKATVAEVAAEGGAPAMAVVTLAGGTHIFVAELRYDDHELQAAVRVLGTTGHCQLALLNRRNGRPLTMELTWPPLNLPSVVAPTATEPSRDVFEAVEHPHVRRQAQALADHLGQAVDLHRCLVRLADVQTDSGRGRRT